MKRVSMLLAMLMAVVFLGLSACAKTLPIRPMLTVQDYVTSPFSVVIDYNMSLSGMIAAGGFGFYRDDNLGSPYINPNITEDNFPFEREGVAKIKLSLVTITNAMETDDIINALTKMSMRPATLPELIAFGSKYRGKYEIPINIMALGSSMRSPMSGNLYSPILSFYGNALYLEAYDQYWYEKCYSFLAVRE